MIKIKKNTAQDVGEVSRILCSCYKQFKETDNYSPAQQAWLDLNEKQQPPLTTDYVLDETLTLLKARADNKTAIEFAKNIYRMDLKIIYISPKDFKNAVDYFVKYQDKSYSFTDCVSFTVMRNFNIKQVFTFDHHFEQAGFVIIK